MKFVMRHKKAFIALIVLGIGIYFISRAGFFSATIPPEFEEARLRGALISEAIVNLSRESVSVLEKVNELDEKRDFTEALNMTSDLLKQSGEIRNKAVELSGELEKMTQALSKINSFEARQAALEAISNRLALIARLVNYSAYFSDLLNALNARFSGASGDHQVEAIIGQINAEITAINNFNAQAGQAMERFDAIVKGN
ncbi:hypothetical protein C4571_03250 [Candidatus Parcubacteria bacterium]|nr:MAG: hypothetical protein C4571_03250 [Candidatus Parcubacteria bacterium]